MGEGGVAAPHVAGRKAREDDLSIYARYDKVLAAIGIVAYEGRLRRMGAEVRKATRRINVLTESVLPRLRGRMRAVRLALEEREREDVFRMKRFKKARRKEM